MIDLLDTDDKHIVINMKNQGGEMSWENISDQFEFQTGI